MPALRRGVRLGVVAASVLALAPTGANAAASPAQMPALHAVRGAAPGIFDAGGRQVLLRGANDNQLGDYYRVSPQFDPTIPLSEADFAAMAAMGFDVVRLIVHWSALEPAPGAFDAGYLARIRQAVGWARAHGVYVVLDMHQDAWGKYIASPPEVICPPGLSPSVGWDGAPQWATITDGQSTCHLFAREIAPAVGQAWQNFYDDRSGIQTELVATWGRLAGAFAADPTIAGYDLINEPNPGLAPGANDQIPLGQYYARATAAIRAAEQAAPGGFAHVVFFEPEVLWSAAGTSPTPPASLVNDPNSVFAPHLYGGSLTLDGVGVDQGYQYAEQSAAAYQSTIWSGEWGWFGEPASDAASILDYAHHEDAALIGGAWWQFKQACGDPHNFSGPGTRPGAISPSLIRFACPTQVSLGIPATTRRILDRAYPRAAPGRLTRLSSDPQSGAFTVAGTAVGTQADCRLDVWIPDEGRGRPLLAGRGVAAITVVASAGGWRASGCANADYELRVTGWTPARSRKPASHCRTARRGARRCSVRRRRHRTAHRRRRPNARRAAVSS
jgi:endoglycosylceramidase